MAYASGSNLPFESASKLGHINVIESEWVKSLVKEFESMVYDITDSEKCGWEKAELEGVQKLKHFWAVDGSYVTVASDTKPCKEVSFVKTALMSIDRLKLDEIDKDQPHPLLLQDIMKKSAVQHATVFPLRNIKNTKGSNYDTVRHIVRDSMKIDQNGVFYETLKWLVYEKWSNNYTVSPDFQCPHCSREIIGFEANSDEKRCEFCDGLVFLTDMIGFHLDMEEDSAPESVSSAYMLIMEHLMLFTIIRLMWEYEDQRLVTETLFIKDGPLTLRSQYSKLVPKIRSFLEYAKKKKRTIHIIGQEKSGVFFDHLSKLSKELKPNERGETMHYSVLTHEYIRKEVYRKTDLVNPYGKRTNWGEKIYVKADPNSYFVLNIPTGDYINEKDSPRKEELVGLDRILATIPEMVSHRYTGALFPIELANGIASMSSYPSSRILQRFLEEGSRNL
ncbi:MULTISPECIES: hypothetical protein [Bacillus cereus group]|uniref:hypothetical protein n=1 Tax=Bacillus cereus group TaxID=86661 RepID=UPI000B4A9E4D|nr:MULTISPECIES: hypothetical protein [Bacillus cereus group]MBY5228943.1 hypothetical protein [Bacillus paranthracis]MCY9250056.1 hypothetical protein [Bacillus paranthracis]MDA1498083.1 hypothetical protein [Bacillus cereus group sp. TH41-1LC]MDA1684187.1 hypothetical protein [Bacillus cereus group sp. m2-21]MDA1694825.1 hypothetical protein [Bacillus cereus group sp. m1-2]